MALFDRKVALRSLPPGADARNYGRAADWNDVKDHLEGAEGTDIGPAQVIATGSSTARALKDRAADVVNVKDFGAKGDNATDDAPAFAAALATGKSVFVPPGSYLVRAPIAIPTGGKLIGSGKDAVIVVPDAGFVGERVITNYAWVAGNANISVSDLAIRVTTATPVTGSAPGIMRFERVDGLSIDRIYTDTFGSAYSAVDLSGGNRRVRVSGCRLKNTSTTTGGALWIRGGSYDDSAFDSYDITITGNYLESASDEAFVVYGWNNTIKRVTVTGNTILNTATAELALGVLGYNVVGQDGAVQDIAIVGNTIVGKSNILTGASRVIFGQNSITGPTGGTLDAVLVSEAYGGAGGPVDVKIIGNVINGATQYGILAAGTDIGIESNEVIGTTLAGIYASTGSRVVGNTVKATVTGIQALNGVRTVRGNRVYGGEFGIVVSGPAAAIDVDDNEIAHASNTAISCNALTLSPANIRVRRNRIRGDGINTSIGVRAFNGGTFSNCVAEGNSTESTITSYSLPAGWRKSGNTAGTTLDPWPPSVGTSANRPSLDALDAGFVYRDTTLDADGLPILWNGAKWIKMDGTDA